MFVLIDADIPKYKCGFASQKEVWTSDSGVEVSVGKIKGGMKLDYLDGKQPSVIYQGVSRKADVLADLGGEWESEIRPEPEAFACATTKKFIDGILRRTGATNHIPYLSRGKCFRHHFYPAYKEGRPPKPYHLKTIEDYLINYRGAYVCEDIEADDAMGIFQCQRLLRGDTKTVIASTDKDLDTIPGLHFNFDEQKFYYVSPEEADFNFWCQTLTGDRVDNIPGLKGVGKKTAEKMLKGVNPKKYRETVVAEWVKAGHTEEDFVVSAKLLWILRKPFDETYSEGL